MKADDKIIEIRKLTQKYAFSSIQLHENIGRKIGLIGTDHKYLGFFIQKGKMTAGELATLSGLTTGAVTGLIDRFERKKLVKRQVDKTDRRKIIILPNNEKIVDLIKPSYQDFQDNIDDLLSSFNENELLIIERFFLKSLEIVENKIVSLNH